MHLDCSVNLLVNLFAALYVFGSKPNSQLLVTHSRMKPLTEFFIGMAVADEARVKLDRFHRSNQGWQILNQGIGNTTTAKKFVGNLALGFVECVNADSGWAKVINRA